MNSLLVGTQARLIRLLVLVSMPRGRF